MILEIKLMNREDILKKSREENDYLDEREQHEIHKSLGFGGVIVTILCVVLSVIKALQGRGFYEFGVIVFGYMSAFAWRSYAKTKKKNYLTQAIVFSFALISGFVGYFILV